MGCGIRALPHMYGDSSSEEIPGCRRRPHEKILLAYRDLSAGMGDGELAGRTWRLRMGRLLSRRPREL